MFCARIGAGALLALIICGTDYAQGQQSQPGSSTIALPPVDVTASPDQAVTNAAPFDVTAHPAGQTITTLDQEQTKDAPDSPSARCCGGPLG